jgi:hypothetical protein
MKILIVVLGCKNERSFLDLDDCGRETWIKVAKQHPNVVDVLHMYGVPSEDPSKPKVIRDGGDLFFNVKEEFDNQSRKNIECFQYINKEYPDIDYVYRTNLSSFIHIQNLVDTLSQSPKSNFYAGQIRIAPTENFKFASGSGFAVSRDVVKLISENKSNINLRAPDDLPLGRFLHQSKVPFTNIGWHRMNDVFDKTDFINFPKNVMQYRLKTYPKYGGDRREDLKKMKELYKIFYE